MPTLSETARQILESNDPTPDRDAQQMTPNAQTLRPGSKGGELSRPINPGSNPPIADEDDEMEAVTSPYDQQNLGALFSKNLNKDSGWQHKPAMPVSQTDPQGLAEDDEMEISEELQSFIDGMLEEGYSEEEILEAIEENFEMIEEGKEEKAAKRPVGRKPKQKLEEAIDALLEGEDFSDDFRVKAETIFESAVNERVEQHVATLEEAYAAALEEEVSAIQEQLLENVDSYLNYAVQEWINENEVAIETGLRTDITEDFMSGLKNLFAENYIDLPEDKVNVVEGFGAKIETLESQLNEEIEKNIENQKIINEAHRYMIVNESVRGLTETQAAKLQSLVEKVNFTDVDEFAEKVSVLRESYFPGQVIEGSNTLDTDEYEEGKTILNEEVSGRMGAYVKVLGKQTLKD